jgi:glucan biosynthesis protein C
MTTRLHHLDAARAVLLLLGIPFHVATTATMILSPGFPGFVADPAVGIGLSFIHAFRMSAFFMLAGYFPGMASQRRGRHDWLADRMMRVALPLVASVASSASSNTASRSCSPRLGAGYGWPVAFEHLWFLIVLLGYFHLCRCARVSRAFPTGCGARCSGSIPAHGRWPCWRWRCGAPG